MCNSNINNPSSTLTPVSLNKRLYQRVICNKHRYFIFVSIGPDMTNPISI